MARARLSGLKSSSDLLLRSPKSIIMYLSCWDHGAIPRTVDHELLQHRDAIYCAKCISADRQCIVAARAD